MQAFTLINPSCDLFPSNKVSEVIKMDAKHVVVEHLDVPPYILLIFRP